MPGGSSPARRRAAPFPSAPSAVPPGRFVCPPPLPPRPRLGRGGGDGFAKSGRQKLSAQGSPRLPPPPLKERSAAPAFPQPSAPGRRAAPAARHISRRGQPGGGEAAGRGGRAAAGATQSGGGVRVCVWGGSGGVLLRKQETEKPH